MAKIWFSFKDYIFLQDVRAKYQQLPNPSEESDTDMPYDERQVVTGEAMDGVINSFQSASPNQINNRLQQYSYGSNRHLLGNRNDDMF